MYPDTILFIVGGILAILAILLLIYLIISHKRSEVYRTLLRQETEFYDALTTTSSLTKDILTSVKGESKTALMFDIKTSNIETYNIRPLIAIDKDKCIDSETVKNDCFDASVLEGRYIIKKEIYEGGMSRVFIAESTKLGNLWIVKFISNQNGELINEENILKLLNHISLPKIIDIFRDEKGVYLVESFIDGVTLDSLLDSGQKLNQIIIFEWAEQLARVLNYLHNLEPHPIYHYDLKPSNIMVTHDNRLVLIDFGISKRFGKDEENTMGVTYQYAAPEQLKHRIALKHMPILEKRFGELPADRIHWHPDARTDIFSLGTILFELAVGQIPTVKNINMLKDKISTELFEIISKCLNINPDDRYQSANEMLAALQMVKGSKEKMARALFKRKLASMSAAIIITTSGLSLIGGYYIYGQENAALLGIRSEVVVVSLQQSRTLVVEKKMPNGNIITLDSSQIRWSSSKDNVARVDGCRISGMNLGETVLTGYYRNKDVSLNVRVVEPMDGMVDISQYYQAGSIVSIFAGTDQREHNDGTLTDAEFVSPESIAVADDGTIYVTDSGQLRIISSNRVDSINFEPRYLTSKIVRCFKNEVYVLTNEWEDDEGIYYGIIRLGGEEAEGLYLADAKFTAVEDFEISPAGLIYFIDRNAGIDGYFLKTLNPADTNDIRTLCELPKGTSGLTMDEHGTVYLANPQTGAIQVWRNDTLSYFAGVENEKAFVDGNAPLFYMPQKIKYFDGFLYIWDFNVLRRISIVDGVPAESITIIGEASPTFEMEITETMQAAESIILPNSRMMDFTVKGNRIFLTDPKRGVIWWVEKMTLGGFVSL